MEVYIPQSDYIESYRPGSRTVHVHNPQPFSKRIAWRPFTRQGRLYIHAAHIAKKFPTFVPVWNGESNGLRLYIKPFGLPRTAGSATRSEALRIDNPRALRP
jgi:hypothetical protein